MAIRNTWQDARPTGAPRACARLATHRVHARLLLALLPAVAGCEGGTQLTGVHCEPGTLDCDGNTAVRCDETGDRWNTIVLCPPDLECQAGVCVDTHAGRCGDGECRARVETCLNCAADCACGADALCLGGGCVPRGELYCGDESCTAEETCSGCIADCACGAGMACRGDACVADTACGDGTCAAGEDCLICGTDCSCEAGTICRSGACAPPPEPISVAALSSSLTRRPDYSAVDDLQRDWVRYGDIPIRMDITSLAFAGISNADLEAVGADVLVVTSDPALTSGEVETVLAYVAAGRGFVGILSLSLESHPEFSEIVGVQCLPVVPHPEILA
jgi:hypothetical protein